MQLLLTAVNEICILYAHAILPVVIIMHLTNRNGNCSICADVGYVIEMHPRCISTRIFLDGL